MKEAIILDIDGVILDTRVILKEILEKKLHGDEMWDYFYQNCNSSRILLMKNIIPFLDCLDPSVCVILSTARNEKCRKETAEKLNKEGIAYDILYMRKNGDLRPSSEVKKDHIKLIKKEFEIVAFIDDDLSNCKMAEAEGLLALRKV
jgi:predicted secreted acid phosphatase